MLYISAIVCWIVAAVFTIALMSYIFGHPTLTQTQLVLDPNCLMYAIPAVFLGVIGGFLWDAAEDDVE